VNSIGSKDEDFHKKEERKTGGAFQYFIEDAAPNIPEPESLNSLREHNRIPEMEPVDLNDAVYEIDKQEDEDAIYM